jgi:uncharacterized protein
MQTAILWAKALALTLLCSIIGVGAAYGRGVGPPTTSRAAGTEDRNWVAGPSIAPISQPIYSVTTQPVSIPTRDGLILGGTLYLPQGVTGPQPCILQASGYPASLDFLYTPILTQLAPRGYPIVFVKLRGVDKSQGVAGLYDGFGTDTYDSIEWLAQQPYCNGNVGMVGSSLLGISQLLGAKLAPPHLKVLVPDDPNSDTYWYLWHPGGMNPGPGRAARPANEYPPAVAHPNYDSYWRDRTVRVSDLSAIAARGIPVLLSSGWDSYMLGTAQNYEWLKLGNPGNRLKMILGPYGHGATAITWPGGNGQSVQPFTGFEYATLWLDRWLKGTNNQVEKQPPVLIYVQGPNQWRFEQDWPLPDEHRTRMYMREQASGTQSGLNDGSLSSAPPQGDGSVSYKYSPSGPYNVAAVNLTDRPLMDKTPYEANGLSWTSVPLDVATELTGFPQITFWASATASDTDFVVEVTDVGPADSSGKFKSLQVTRGYLNASHYFSRSDPQALIPGSAYQFVLQLFPTSYVFAAGHRIRVTVQGSAIDPTITGANALTNLQGPGLNPLPATVTMYQDSDHPTFIDLPIVGSGWTSLNANAGPTGAPLLIEYYDKKLDHYFMTSLLAETDVLDNGIFPGWTRTGHSIGAAAPGSQDVSPVCRFYIPPAQGDSHFYTASPTECATVQSQNYSWILESTSAFYIATPNPFSGGCQPGSVPVFRVWDKRVDTNHRYTTSRAVRDQMVARGWVPEGYGADSVIMCSPQ